MPVTNLNNYLTQGAIEGFLDLVMPITAFSYVVKPGASALNDVVRVPFAQNTSASYAFAYSTGYASEGNTITGKSVTMDTLLYQKITLTDSDLAVLNPEALVRIGRQAGGALGIDFISASLASVATAANFPNSGSNVATNYTSSTALAALDKAANDYKWPDGERFLICGTTLWQSLMLNSTVTTAANFGSSDPVQLAQLKNVLGFAPFKYTKTLPNSATGIAVNPNAILIGNAYHAPTDAGSQYTAVQQITDEKTGLTIGFRQYYDPAKASNVRVFDILGGAGVGNANALYWIK